MAIARALVTNPAMILADEPTGNLDTASTREILEIFERLSDEGRTIILITHEHEVAAHAERVIELSDGHDRLRRREHAAGGVAVSETVRVAFAGLAANKLRSGLTILGLMIGVGSVIILVAVGTGSSAAVAVPDRRARLQRPARPVDADARRAGPRRQKASPSTRSPSPTPMRCVNRSPRPTCRAPRRWSTPTA